MDILDASQSTPLRGGPSFSLKNRLQRALWLLVWAVAASWTPPALRAWRCWLLRRFGARVASGADVRGSASVWYPPNLVMHEGAFIGARVQCYCMGPIEIGAGAVVSEGAHLCGGTHDAESADFQLIARSITIGPRAWVATEAFVGPGMVMGEGAVASARSVVFGRLAAWTVYAGNPGQAVGRRTPGRNADISTFTTPTPSASRSDGSNP